MDDSLPKRLQELKCRLKVPLRNGGRYVEAGVKRLKKNNILLGAVLVVVGTGLFYLVSYAASEKEFGSGSSDSKNFLTAEIIDPLSKIGKGIGEQACGSSSLCIQEEENEEVKNRERIILGLIVGYPIEEMVEYISEREKETAAFLVAIAKKESDWGKHSPSKSGKKCYNYWGYKGAYNLTDSGYSCFDSAEQAVEIVGGRISELIGKKIDTPEKMVVWKCGSTCAGHDPGSVEKWISDVSQYVAKLENSW